MNYNPYECHPSAGGSSRGGLDRLFASVDREAVEPVDADLISVVRSNMQLDHGELRAVACEAMGRQV